MKEPRACSNTNRSLIRHDDVMTQMASVLAGSNKGRLRTMAQARIYFTIDIAHACGIMVNFELENDAHNH